MAKSIIPEKLGECKILKEHDDGDLTIECGGKKMVVTTEGEIFTEIDIDTFTRTEEIKSSEEDKMVEVPILQHGPEVKED